MKPLRLLYVDDNLQDRLLFHIALRSVIARLAGDVVCDEANSGQEAISKLETSRYDMIFLDQQMPEQDGLQTFANMRDLATAKKQELPVVIAYSNCDLSDFKLRCLRAGMNEFVVKYVNPEGLAALLRKHQALP